MNLPWRLARRPKLSIVLIVYKMPDQAERTIRSLSTELQRGVTESDYEIIVVENHSSWLLGEERAVKYGTNIRYFQRHETQRSPVNAVNFGASKARGTHLAIAIDGARMLTPGVVRSALEIFCLNPEAAVSVTGYHIGEKLQQKAVNEGYNEQVEAEFLKKINWPEDGYRLFDIGVLAGSCMAGFFLPNSESNFICMSISKWKQLGGMDSRFNDFGGGNANLDIYKRLLESPNTPFYLLYAEGSFHQFHGGVTTNTLAEERAATYAMLDKQDQEIRGDNRAPPTVVPILYGRPHRAMYKVLRHSIDKAEQA